MKTLLVLNALIALSLLSPTAHAQELPPSLVTHSLSVGYIPHGFDDNDNVQVTVEGVFSNSCYKTAPAQFTVAEDKISIKQMSYFYYGFCLQVIVPFHETLDLGIVKRGNYKVVDANSGRLLGNLPVTRAMSSSADDFLYAPIADAFVKTKDGESFVHLTGKFTDSCFNFNSARITVEDNVIVVLPFATRGSSENCQKGFFPYQGDVSFPTPKEGRYLLHVRSLDGQAVNKLIDVTSN